MFSKPPIPVNQDDTPKSSQSSRTAWSPLFCQNGETFQIRILCQKTSTARFLYSSAGPACKRRPTWAPIVECRYVVKKGKQKLEFVNYDNEVKDWEVDTLNPLVYETNRFTQRCAGMLVDHQIKLFSYYLTLTSRSEGFCTHTEDYDKHGFSLKDSGGLKLADLMEEGGTIEDLTVFQSLAMEHSFVFDKRPAEERDMRLSSLNKRKITDFFQTTPQKMTKKEKVENNFRLELEDEAGLEKSLKDSFVNFKVLHISKLKVSPNLFLRKNEARVKELMETMELQFDPAQVILTVCPEDLELYENSDKIDQLEFHVVAGQHKLAALQGLEKQGKLDKLPGIKNKKIPCYVCKATSAATTNFANIRANDSSCKFKNTTPIEELIFVYHGLVKVSENPEEAKDVVKRICYTRQAHAEDVGALMKILDWPAEILQQVMAVLESFRRFQTLDASSYGSKSRLKNKAHKSLTQTQFRLLGKCQPRSFVEMHLKVLQNDLSLKDLLLESKHQNDLEKTCQTVAKVAGHSNIQFLKEKYPDKFTPEKLEKYVGADMSHKNIDH